MNRGRQIAILILLVGGLVWPGASPAVSAVPAAPAGPASPAGVGWTWAMETVDATGDAGEYASLTLDPNGRPRIAYYDRTNGDLKYAYHDGTAWHFETVDSTGNVGQHCALTMDSATPRVSYYDATNGDLKYAYRSVTGWSVTTVDSVGNVGQSTAIAFQPSTYNPYICYYDVTNSDLKYAYHDMNGWHVAAVDTKVDGDPDCAIAMDGAGNPHISYYAYSSASFSGNLKYAWWNGTSWQFTTVESGGSGGRVGLYSSLLVDANGYPHISYQRLLPTPVRVRYAYQDAGGWHLSTVASESTLGFTSLVLDGQGHRHLAYINYSTGTLYYAHDDGSGWVVQTVETGYDDSYASLEVDAFGHPRIAYGQKIGAEWNLRYAYACIWTQATHSPAPACVNTPVAFTNATTGTLPITYLWAFGDGITSTVADPTHTYAAAGVYTASLTGTNSCGSDVAVQTVVISSTPDASFSYTPTQICAGTAVQFSNTTVGSATLSFIWDFGDGYSSYERNPTHAYDLPGPYQVTLLAMNNCGVDTYQAGLTVHGRPTNPDLTWEPVPPEVGHIVTFTASASSTLPVSYTWDLGDGHAGSGVVVAHVYTDTGTYTVTLTATNSCGASATTANVSVVCNPVSGTTFAWLPPDPVRGEAISFTAVATGTTPLAYAWSFGDGDTGQGAFVTHTYAVAGDYTATLTTTNFCGVQAASRPVHICGPVAEPAFTWNPPDPVRGDLVTFTAQASGTAPITYTWDFGDTHRGQGAVTTHTYGAGGTYPVVLTTTNPCGEVSTTQRVDVCGPVTAGNLTWSPPTPTVGFPVSFTAALTGTEPLSCTWDWGDGTSVGPGTCTSPAVHTYATTGTFTITLTAMNGCGLDLLSGTLTVVALPQAVFSSNTPVCLGTAMAFTNSSSGADPLAFAWDFGDGHTATETNPLHTYAQAGPYTVQLTAANAYGHDHMTASVAVWSAPLSATFTFVPAEPAPGTIVTFTAVVSGGYPTAQFQWNLGDGTYAGGAVVTHTYWLTGTYPVLLEAGGSCGVVTATQDVAVAYCARPDGLVVVHSAPLIAGQRANFTATLAVGSAPLTYAWDLGDGSPPLYGPPVITHTYATAGNYTVSVAVWNDCGMAGPSGFPVQVDYPTSFVYLPLVFKSYYPGDSFEPDNTPAQANRLGLANPQQHDFAPEEDVDWVYLDLAAGTSYRFQTLDLAGGADTRLFLYRPGAYDTPLAGNDDWATGNCGGTPPDPKASCFDYTPTTAGRFELKVDQYEGGAVWGPAVQYSVEATQR